ncbi:hypothetical protein BJ508DRAFT_329565 [Ascobolus immersus RN42]|uniref:DUF4219 domain-containing protein n=1 Tax=Ascobolus immersus RN42 TaxID=1160509 RepID=A0A3N4I005_ASCIM|nr:hypothetical protein BJ508DRAFT_329565 [Ascobolus immersus RN42]
MSKSLAVTADTSDSGVKNSIPRLNDRNWPDWSSRMQYLLDKEGTLWTIIKVPEKPTGTGDLPEFSYFLNLGAKPGMPRFIEKWQYDSDRAIRAMLPFLDVTRHQEVLIMKEENKTAAEVWNALKERYQKSDDSTNMSLIMDLVQLEIPNGASLKHVQKTFDEHLLHLNKLRSTKITVEQILTSFTMRLAQQAFPSIVDSLSCQTESLKPETIVNRCLESARRSDEMGSDTPRTTLLLGKRKQGKDKCSYCKWTGHNSENCYIKDPSKAPPGSRQKFEDLKAKKEKERSGDSNAKRRKLSAKVQEDE